MTGQLLILNTLIMGCGNQKSSTLSSDAETSFSPLSEANILEVQGSGAFGSQCPHGFFSEPRPIPLEFITDQPPTLSLIELNEHLPAFTFQIDCIKMTLDVRKEGPPPELTTWEVMPDGNFYLTIQAGTAKLKKDFQQISNCSIPLQADMWGKIDCTDLDHPIMKIETVWWTGKSSSNPNPGPTHSPSPSPSPSGGESPLPPTPNPSPSPVPVSPPHPLPSPSMGPGPLPETSPLPTPPHGPTPMPWLSFGPTPQPTPSLPPEPEHRGDSPLRSFTLTHSSSPLHRLGSSNLQRRSSQPRDAAPRSEAPLCELPPGSYFHNMTMIHQCR